MGVIGGGRARCLPALVLVVSCWPAAASQEAANSPRGVVVDRVQPGSPGAIIGLRPDDLVIAWQRTARADAPADGGPRGEALPGAWAVDHFQLEVAPRWPISLEVRRDGELLALPVPMRTSRLGIAVRPGLRQDEAAAWTALLGAPGAAGGEAPDPAGDFLRIEASLKAEGRDLDAAWLRLRWADHLVRRRAFAAAAEVPGVVAAAARRRAPAAGPP